MILPINTDIFIRDEVVVVGHNEDGEVHGTRFDVILELPNGERWTHMMTFDKVRDAENLATRVRKARAAQLSNSSLWVSIDPAYGSRAYQELDNTGYFHKREKEECEMKGL